MANHADPLEDLAWQVQAEQRRFRVIAERDNTIDEEEHAVWVRLGEMAGKLRNLSAKRKLARHIENDQPLTDYSHRLAANAGFDLIDLDAERRKRGENIVPFPNRLEIG